MNYKRRINNVEFTKEDEGKSKCEVCGKSICNVLLYAHSVTHSDKPVMNNEPEVQPKALPVRHKKVSGLIKSIKIVSMCKSKLKRINSTYTRCLHLQSKKGFRKWKKLLLSTN